MGSSVAFFAVIGLVIATLGVPSPASALPVFLDEFSVVKNGAPLFQDSFNDGVPPPSAPNFAGGTPASYFVNGTLNEANGKVRLDTTGAAIVPPVGGPALPPFFFERALLLTNRDPGNVTAGLKSGDTFSVSGRFDLAVPSVRFQEYSVSLNDGTPTNTANDLLRLAVRRTGTGFDLVQFFRLDLQADTFTSIAFALLDPNHDQIDLILSRTSTANNAITASFAYVDNGVSGPLTAFGPTANIFNGENFTRAQFEFASPTPEPTTLLLFGTTAAGLGLARWRQRRRKQEP